MIYPASFEQKIGFDRLREQVAARCTMRAAREQLAAETFSTSPQEIERRLALADEMRLLLDMERDFPGGEYPDTDEVVAKLRVAGTFLDVAEVAPPAAALALIGAVVEFIGRRGEHYPALHDLTHGVESFPEIVRRIEAIVDRFGNVRDTASPALAEVRRAIREREGQAAKRLQAVLSAANGGRHRRGRRTDLDPRRSCRDPRLGLEQTQAQRLHPRRVGHGPHLLRRAGRGRRDQQRTARTGVCRAARDRPHPHGVHRVDPSRRGADRRLGRLPGADRHAARQGTLGLRERLRAPDPLDGRPPRAQERPPSAPAADLARAGARDRAPRPAARPPQAHPRHLGTQCRRQVRLPEDHGHRAVHVPVRLPRAGVGDLRTAGLPLDLHRHRRRAVDRQRPVDLFVAPAQHEAHARRGVGPHAGAHRRVRIGHGAQHRRGDRRGDPRAAARKGGATASSRRTMPTSSTTPRRPRGSPTAR